MLDKSQCDQSHSAPTPAHILRDMGTLLMSSVVRGYHVHISNLLEAFLGEEFVVLHRADNDYDRHAMAVYCVLEAPHVIMVHFP